MPEETHRELLPPTLSPHPSALDDVFSALWNIMAQAEICIEPKGAVLRLPAALLDDARAALTMAISHSTDDKIRHLLADLSPKVVDP